jgi:hypothetical protein
MNRRQAFAVLVTVAFLLCIVAPDVMADIARLLRDMATLILLGK